MPQNVPIKLEPVRPASTSYTHGRCEPPITMDPPRNFNTWNRSTDTETIQRTPRQPVTHHDPLQSTLAPSNVQRAQRTPRQPNPSRPATPEPGDLNTRSAATDTHPTYESPTGPIMHTARKLQHDPLQLSQTLIQRTNRQAAQRTSDGRRQKKNSTKNIRKKSGRQNFRSPFFLNRPGVTSQRPRDSVLGLIQERS